MSEKVVLDKNVLIGGSIGVEIDGKRFEDNFYRESIELMNLLDSSNEVEGWIYSSEKERVKEILDKVISSSFAMSEHRDKVYRECRRKLDENVENLYTIEVSDSEYRDYFEEVDKFYSDLKEEFGEKFQSRKEIVAELNQKASLLDSSIKEISSDFDNSRYEKLYDKIVKNPAEKEDRKLLAKTAYLGDRTDREVYFASTDLHFVPLRRPESLPGDRFVSDRIEEYLDVKCRWPSNLCESFLEN